jgi:protein TonB
MNAGADRVLADRARRVEAPPGGGSLAVAALLHGAVLALVFLLPRLAPPPKPLEFVPVQVVPAAALGVRKPLPPAPAPEPAKSAPAEPEPLPEPEPKKTDAPVLPPEKPVKPKPETPKPEPVKPAAKPTTAPAAPKAPAAPSKGPTAPNPRPAAPAAPQATPGTEVGRRGSPTGTPLGSSSFGSEIAGLDNPDFTYGYYIDQLLAAIDSNWVRPPVGDRVRAIVSFRIQRNGSITDLRVAEASGFNAFDLAALRAVQSAAPFPPLPRAYKNDSLGVNLIVR